MKAGYKGYNFVIYRIPFVIVCVDILNVVVNMFCAFISVWVALIDIYSKEGVEAIVLAK